MPVEKRDLYLQRVAAMLKVRGRGHFNDADVADVASVGVDRLGASAGGMKSTPEGANPKT